MRNLGLFLPIYLLLLLIGSLVPQITFSRIPAHPTACIAVIKGNASTGPVTSLSCDGQPSIRLPRKSLNVQEEQSGQIASIITMTGINLNGCQTVSTSKDTFFKFVCVFAASR